MFSNGDYTNITKTGTESRKDSHVSLALSSQNDVIDSRFFYEPMMAPHPDKDAEWNIRLGNKILKFPIWVSSMTGGTAKTNELNIRLAKATARFGLGMGIGSVRIALEDLDKVKDFNLRPVLGEEIPFYINLGIAQIEKMLRTHSIKPIRRLVNDLDADGIIIHVNPLQEWIQPEGDTILHAPINTIRQFMKVMDMPMIVKEVGQGFGYQSLKSLMQLPLTAIEFAANGGTNFSKVELQRSRTRNKYLLPLVHVGQSAGEMVDLSNRLLKELGDKVQCRTFIISGGIKNFLDGYYFIQKSNANALYGQASEMLRHARESQEDLDEFIRGQIEGLLLARAFLTIKEK